MSTTKPGKKDIIIVIRIIIIMIIDFCELWIYNLANVPSLEKEAFDFPLIFTNSICANNVYIISIFQDLR